GFVFQGEASKSHGLLPRGVPSAGQPLFSFVAFNQNHDQVGNRAFGERLSAYSAMLDGLEFRKAMQELRALWVLGNEYLTEAAPWAHFKTDKDQAAVGIRFAINLIAFFAHVSRPIVPQTAEAMLNALRLPAEPLHWPTDMQAELTRLEPGHGFDVPDVLFAKIEDEQIADWSHRFGGAENAA
ncbi:MAG: hypothetical protein AAGF19_09785, partial [Pseudomonadota bacterium]